MRRGLKGRASGACWVLSFALLLPAIVAAQDQPQKANITIALSKTARDGTTFTPVRGGGSATVGEAETHYFYTTAKGDPSGGGDRPPEAYAGMQGMKVTVTPGGATGGVSGGGGVAGAIVTRSSTTVPAPQYDYLWQVAVKPVSIALDVVTFDLDWQRTDVKDGARQVAAGDHRTITLRQGERHLLDFLPCAPDAACANVFLEVQAAPLEDVSLAQTALTYDLWLVHRTAEGAKVMRHGLVSGRQGEKLSFNFAPVPLQLDAAVSADAGSPYRLLVSGTIVGRQKPDGTIEVALQPTRRQQFAAGGGGFAGGVKTFVSNPDETTSVALPPGGGMSAWDAPAGFKLTTPRPGVSMQGDSVRVDLKPFFEGTETSILVTVHKEK